MSFGGCAAQPGIQEDCCHDGTLMSSTLLSQLQDKTTKDNPQSTMSTHPYDIIEGPPISPIATAPDWTNTPDSVLWFSHLRLTISSITSRSITIINEALQVYQKTDDDHIGRYLHLQCSLRRLQRWWEHTFIVETQMTKEYLREMEGKLMELGKDLDPRDMIAEPEVPVVVSKEMREVRAKAREVLREAAYIVGLVQEALVRLQELEDGQVGQDMFPTLPGYSDVMPWA
ncbi:uncharacterized protein EURHEDRAFT_402864 [Aspergillus ruber CBS 135680]|uniref:Uncharacterized protein n=1 Tax=Aspergillus ruber (strain CBS 135680) TaxID=1388766 RepID=A0A017SF17_ASPRC|nr:uncharacterized protein EURHEDRAFT_402864 [Aspergillus ruber CBS 135680]EYE95234.1 hypothetical protein EURHEDRAFT_402864 [Aspergillus ruber CBS 135680]